MITHKRGEHSGNWGRGPGCVYVVRDRTGVVIYVGTSKWEWWRRMLQHLSADSPIFWEMDTVTSEWVEDEDARFAREAELITYYQPRHNRDGNRYVRRYNQYSRRPADHEGH